jgi:undecaprenyl-diphosphatase
MVALLRSASRFGDWGLSASVGVVMMISQRWQAFSAWLVVTALALILQGVMKRVCGRTRPCHRPGGPPQRASIPDKGSFPSGHTLHAVLAVVVMTKVASTLVPLFAILALLIGVSRVALGVHYPSDVAAGAILGAAIGSVVLAAV